MSNLALTPQWHDAINQVETNEKIVGGATGNANLASKQLAENILWLKNTIENIRNEPIQVGDIYTTTISHTSADDVATHHGYGTWVRYAEGRTLVGHSTKIGDPTDYKTIGNEFGANTHTLIVDETPSHKHSQGEVFDNFVANIEDAKGTTDVVGLNLGATRDTDNSGNEIVVGGLTEQGKVAMKSVSVGGDQPHNNIQPSIVVAYWLRTA